VRVDAARRHLGRRARPRRVLAGAAPHDTSRARVARAVFTTRDDRCAGDDDPTRRARGEDDAHRSFDRASTARDVARDAETRSNARAVDRARARATIASDGSRDARDRRAMTRAR